MKTLKTIKFWSENYKTKFKNYKKKPKYLNNNTKKNKKIKRDSDPININ